MDTDRRAAIARSLMETPSRRTALSVLAGLGLLGTGGLRGLADTVARAKRGKQAHGEGTKGQKKGKKNKRGGGQEAPIVIYSMTTSTPEDAPRGMSFLYSGNRLNVATSRARCLTIVVASPRLFMPECRTPQQMKLANAFCRYREMALA